MWQACAADCPGHPFHPAGHERGLCRVWGQLGTATLRKGAFSCANTGTGRKSRSAAKARQHATKRRFAKNGVGGFVDSSPAIRTTFHWCF